MVRDFLRDVCGGFSDHKEGNFVGYTANLGGYSVWAVDTHTLGGLFLDWIVGCETVQRWIEVKTPEAFAAKNNSIKPGEAWTLENLRNGMIVYDDNQVASIFYELIAEHARLGVT